MRALNCDKAASSKLPYIEPQTLVCDSRTSRKSAPFRVRANLEPLCQPLQLTVCFLRVLIPAPPTVSLASRLPLLRCFEARAENRAYHVPSLADPSMARAYPVSTCLFPDGIMTTCSQFKGEQPAIHLLVRAFQQLWLFGCDEDSLGSSLTLCIRNLPSLHTARLLAVSARACRQAGPSSEKYIVPRASYPTVTHRACPGRQLLVVQQVTASISTTPVVECDKARMSFAILYFMPLDARRTATRVALEHHP